MRLALLIFWIAMITSSCSQSAGSRSEGSADLKEVKADQIELVAEEIKKGSEKTFDNEEYSFKCAFIPSFYFLKDQKLTDTDLEMAQQEYSASSSFLLEMVVNKYHDEMLKYKMNSAEHYYQRIEYYSFKVQNDIRLITNEDTLVCSSHHFERTYGISPTIRLSLQFPISEEALSGKESIKIEFFDKVYDQGIVNFKIDPEQIKRYKIVNQHSYE